MQGLVLANWAKIDKFFGLCVVIGFFGIVGGFYLFPSYGGVARTYYVFILLPTLLAAPWWLRRASLVSWAWLFFAVPIAYLAVSVFWVADGDFNPNRSEWYFFKPLLFLVFLLLATQIVVQKYANVEAHLLKFVTVVALIAGVISLAQYLPTALERNSWPRMGSMSVNNDINVSASLYGINIFFCAYGLVRWGRRWFWPLLASLLVSLVVVLLTQSKVPVGYFIITLGWLLVQGGQRERLKQLLPAVAVSILIFILILLYFDRVPFLDRTVSYSDRLVLWASAIEQSYSHWYFGHGLGSAVKIQYMGKDYISHAHNYILDTLRYGGVIGALLITTQTLFVAYRGFVLVKIQPQYLPIVVWFYMGVAFLLTNGQQPLVKPHYTWFYYWLPMVLILAKSLYVAKSSKNSTIAE